MTKGTAFRLFMTAALLGALALPLAPPESAEAVSSPQEVSENEILDVLEPVPVLFVDGIGVFPNEDGDYILSNEIGFSMLTTTDAIENSIELRGNWLLASTLDSTSALSILSGSLATNSYPVTVDAFFIGLYTEGTLTTVNLGSSIVNTNTFAIRGSNVVLDAGTSTLTTTLLFDDAEKKGHRYYDVVVCDNNGVYGFVEGNSKFHNLEFAASETTYMSGVLTVDGKFKVKGKIKEQKLEANKTTVFSIKVKDLPDVIPTK